MKKQLVLASNNKNKLKEIKSILKDYYDVVSLKDLGITIDIEETGSTFEENALIKAKAIYDITGKDALSDDSGLMTEALNGAPGVYSARFSGALEDIDYNNNLFLLKKLHGCNNREAKFVSVIVLYRGDKNYISVRGEACGKVLEEPKGTGGFGYDPLFYSYDLKKTFGEASEAEKNSISHRAKALENLLKELKK